MKTTDVHKYLHGFTDDEQQRLDDQANLLYDLVYEKLDFTDVRNLLEIGTGTGVHARMIAERNPNIYVIAIDSSEEQLKKARKLTEGNTDFERRIRFINAKAEELSAEKFPPLFDAVFICWVLEHIKDPKTVLFHAYNALRYGGKIIISEVFNQSLFTYPYLPTLNKYWDAYNKLQRDLDGHPNIGPRVAGWLHNIGFSKIESYPRIMHYDSRNMEDKSVFIEYFNRLILSAASQMIAHNLITEEDAIKTTEELMSLKENPDGVIYINVFQIQALKE